MKENVMILNFEKSTCCGCTACESICPKQAITMQPDENGFTYPHVDTEKCINCSLCQKVCSYQNTLPPVSAKNVFAAISQNTDLSTSASGGLFATLAKSVLNDNGIVYGSAMLYENDKLHVRHIKATSIEQSNLLKGSKYVHSNMQGIFPDVLTELKLGKTVLFSGTPCQIAGLKGFLQKDYSNLYTIDIICHGVPSEQLFQQYIAYEENKHNLKIKDFRFRDKKQGWKLHGSMTFSTNETIYFEPEESSYYQLFLNSYTYRENCYSCPYASDHRPGDITIGDYWCIELVHPELLIENGGEINHEKGVSCMIINNDKGNELFSRYGSGIKHWKSSYENASKYNRQLTAPSHLKEERNIVLELARNNYKSLDIWYRKRLIPIKIRRKIRASVPNPIKNFIKKSLTSIQ